MPETSRSARSKHCSPACGTRLRLFCQAILSILPKPFGMPHQIPNQFVIENGRRSTRWLLDSLAGLPGIEFVQLGPFTIGGETYFLPRYVFRGPNSSDPIRVGIFAAIHGDEPAGTLAVTEFLRALVAEPGIAESYQLECYPVCNPTGFEDNTRHSRRDKDLNREFWKSSAEPEIRILERELRTRHHSGIVQLHADDTSGGIYGFVRGHTLTENLLRPALSAAGRILPRNVNATIDGFAARDGIIYDQYEGILAAPAEMEPVPFEIVLETPHHAPLGQQSEAMVEALRTILSEYRRLVAFAANI